MSVEQKGQRLTSQICRYVTLQPEKWTIRCCWAQCCVVHAGVHVTGSEYVDRGTAIQLVCNATGRPDPPHNVDWYKVCHIYDVVTCKMKLFQNYFSLRRSTYVWNNFAWNYFEIIQEAYCNSWIFSNMFNVAEIISDVVTCEIKHWNYIEIISVFYFTCNNWRWLDLHVKYNTEITSKLF